MPNCPDCKKYLKEGAYRCLCGWRSKPKEPVNCCRKCGDMRAYRCGPEHDSYFLCDRHREELKQKLTKRDYLEDLANDDIQS